MEGTLPSYVVHCPLSGSTSYVSYFTASLPIHWLVQFHFIGFISYVDLRWLIDQLSGLNSHYSLGGLNPELNQRRR
jgi:hypothetical protein